MVVIKAGTAEEPLPPTANSSGLRTCTSVIRTAGLAWTYVVQPIAVWTVVTFQLRIATPPVLDNESLMSLLFALLGMHHTHRLSRRALALGAACCMAVAVLATLSQVVFAHG